MLTLFVAVVVIFVNVKANVFDVITPPAYFYAPYTPFNDDDPNNIRPTINIDAIEDIVENAIDNGVNIFFIGGSNGQFTALSVDERKSLCLAYSQAINNTGNDGIYSIFHVGATRIDEAVELAAFAAECGVNAIGSLPPYYNRVSSSAPYSALFEWFKPQIEASNNMSFWFYHYPDRTNYNINIYSLLEEAITNQALPQLEGIKFNHNDVNDYFQSTNLYSDQVAIVPYYSPALVIFGLDKGFGIGTSDYMAPVVNCLKIASNENRIDDAYWYQSFMNNASSVINDGANYYNAVAYRCVYDRYNISMGNPRPPLLPYTQQQCDDINNNLDAIDFFNQLQQIKDDTTCNPTNPL